MKRFLLWLISVALGVVVLLAAVMGVSYAFTTEGGCPDGAAQFGGQALEANGSCWQVPLLGGQLDKVFASPATLTVQKLGVLYTAHPELTLPDWTGYTALTIQNAAGDVLFAGSAGEYQNFLFPANGEYKAELTAWRVPKGGVITQFEGGSTGQLRKNSRAGAPGQAHGLVPVQLPVHFAGQCRGGAFRRAGGAGRHGGRAHLRHDRRRRAHHRDRPWQRAVRARRRGLARLYPGSL